MFCLKSKLNGLSLLAAIFIAPVIYASEHDSNNDKSVNTLETVVVVASRIEQSLSDVASSVATVSSEDIEKQLSNSIEDSLRYTPGVSLNGNSRFGAADFNVRGMDGSRVKVLIDGVEQPSSYNSGVSGTVMNVLGKGQGQIEADTLTAIEINKGSSSSLYGSGALGGSVLMRTKSTDDLLQGDKGHISIDSGYQSRDESYKATINVAREFNSHVKGMTIFTHRDGNEIKAHGDGADIIGEGRGQADPMNYQSNNILSKLELDINDSHRWILTGQYYKEYSDGSSLSLENTSSGFNTYSNYHFKDKQQRTNLGIQHIWRDDNVLFDDLNWQFNWQTSQTQSATNDTLTSMLPSGGSVERTRQREVKDTSLQLDLQFNKAFFGSMSTYELVYGATLIDSEFALKTQDITSDGNISDGVVEMPPKTDVLKAGIFAQNQMYTLADHLVISTGLRYDTFRYRPKADHRSIEGNIGEYQDFDTSATTGQLGAVFHFTEHTSLFAKYALGFKAPTPEELYYSFERNPIPSMHVVVVPNPDLKPETSQSFEVGIRQNYQTLNWELSAYYNDYDDFINSISWTEIDGGSTYMYSKNENIDSVHIYGVEFSSALQVGKITSLPKGTYLRLSSAWSKGKDTKTNQPIDSVVPLTGVLGVGFDQTDDLYGWEALITAVAGKSGNDWSDKENLAAPGYSVVDITAYARPIDNLTIRGGVFNLFDKKYWNYSRVKGLTTDSVSNPDALTLPGINFGLNAKYIF